MRASDDPERSLRRVSRFLDQCLTQIGMQANVTAGRASRGFDLIKRTVGVLLIRLKALVCLQK